MATFDRKYVIRTITQSMEHYDDEMLAEVYNESFTRKIEVVEKNTFKYSDKKLDDQN